MIHTHQNLLEIFGIREFCDKLFSFLSRSLFSTSLLVVCVHQSVGKCVVQCGYSSVCMNVCENKRSMYRINGGCLANSISNTIFDWIRIPYIQNVLIQLDWIRYSLSLNLQLHFMCTNWKNNQNKKNSNKSTSNTHAHINKHMPNDCSSSNEIYEIRLMIEIAMH